MVEIPFGLGIQWVSYRCHHKTNLPLEQLQERWYFDFLWIISKDGRLPLSLHPGPSHATILSIDVLSSQLDSTQSVSSVWSSSAPGFFSWFHECFEHQIAVAGTSEKTLANCSASLSVLAEGREFPASSSALFRSSPISIPDPSESGDLEEESVSLSESSISLLEPWVHLASFGGPSFSHGTWNACHYQSQCVHHVRRPRRIMSHPRKERYFSLTRPESSEICIMLPSGHAISAFFFLLRGMNTSVEWTEVERGGETWRIVAQ